ncbi:MAG: indolepyruvate oxidoreductase subunit beta family protein [Alphaproteobacteria bacterium]|nr:MAG: indolepyruvate oxidoreductase subunit beta family protein [Alphaproteobacteria bacterium]
MDAQAQAQVATVRPITVAVVALGGEGGGVLADWIVDLAQHGGYLAQATSVPGVAQRTGATIYYVELFPKAAAQAGGRAPVLALMPVPGDVDIVLASELMEGARAIERGFVTPERTLLISSTHRVFAMTEKIALADGRVDAAPLLAACREAARELVAFDMAALAEATGSVLSAVLFGALAGSAALPFPRMAFEAAIRRGQVGVERSLAAFAAGFEAAQSGGVAVPAAASIDQHTRAAPRGLRDLLDAAARDFTGEARAIVLVAIERLAEYQDVSYARQFLARLARFQEIERQHGNGSGALLAETARQLALAMAYEDTIRVAELKIRSNRFARVREEVRIEDGQILEIAEFFHPRTQEIADTLPAALGRWLLRTRWARGLVDRATRKGRVIKTTSIAGFLLLYVLAKLKRLRRRSLRFSAEQAVLAHWLNVVAATARKDYSLAVQVARMRNLVKGYGDTREGGQAKFDQLMVLVPRLLGRSDSGATLEALIKAALADEHGEALDKAIAEMAFTNSDHATNSVHSRESGNPGATVRGSGSPLSRGRTEGMA